MKHIYVRNNNSNNPVQHTYVHTAGYWVSVVSVWVKQNGTWIQVFIN